MYVQAESSTPLWEREQTGLNKYLYIAAGVVVLIIAAVWVGTAGPINFPWTPQNTVAPRATPTPTIAARTDAAAADRYLNGFVAPAMTDLEHSMNLLNETCNGPLTLSCRDNISQTDNQVKTVTGVMNARPVPDCIAPQVSRMKTDLANLDKALQLSLQGYQDNKPTELYQGIAVYRAASQSFAADTSAAETAQKTVCNNQQTGP